MLPTNPSAVAQLSMGTASAVAQYRLIGSSGLLPGLLCRMEIDKRLPPRASRSTVQAELRKTGETFLPLAAEPWGGRKSHPSTHHRSVQLCSK